MVKHQMLHTGEFKRKYEVYHLPHFNLKFFYPCTCSGEKPFKCKNCDKVRSAASQLSRRELIFFEYFRHLHNEQI